LYQTRAHRTVSRLEERFGALSPQAMAAVDRALKVSLSLK